ncbi:MAG: amino acid-binding protein [Prevotellaceae bacterium]|nr:amino acid-binding protein [Prevotellaceae bacterium]
MTVNQLAIFIENKSGKLLKVLQLLKQAGIQIVATTIADTLDYGIWRIICDNPKKAYDMMRENSVSVTMSEAFALKLDNVPGAAADALKIFADEGIGITYLYSFLLGGNGILLFRTDDEEKTRKVIVEKSLATIDDAGLAELI